MKALGLLMSLMMIIALLAACGPTPERVEVEKVITQVVKETVIVAGTPEVVEKEVTKVVQETVEKVVTPTPAPQPEEEKTLVIALSGSPDIIDTHLASGDMANFTVSNQLAGYAIEQKVVEKEGMLIGEPGTMVPMLAESFEVSEDGTTFIFRLRPGLQFSNGDPIDAEVVRWNYERMFATDSVCKVFLNLTAVPDVDHIRVIDERTVEIVADEPSQLFLRTLPNVCHSIVNPNVLEQHATADDPWAREWLRRDDAGSGPFRLISWTTDELVLERDPNWYETEYPKADKLVFKIVPDPATRLFLLGSGAVDAAEHLPREGLDELEKAPNVNLRTYPSTTFFFAVMNQKMPPFDNKKLRQALSYAVPYDTIVEEVMQGYGQRMLSYVPKGAYTHDPSFWKYETNYEKAKMLLAEAGYPDGLDLELTIDAGVPEYEGMAVWMKDGFAKIGVDLAITRMTKATYMDRLRMREYPFALMSWHTTIDDPFNHFNWLFLSECCNYANWYNDQVRQLIADNVLSPDKEAREEASRRVQEMAMEEAVWLLLGQPDYIIATAADVKGVVYYPEDEFWRYRFWYKEGWD